jgi:methionyl-tRNA formyltransferase
LKVIFAGTPKNAALTLRALKVSGIEIVGVVTRCDAPVGRKQILEPSAVALEAESLGLHLLKANSIDEQMRSRLNDLKADLGVVVAYGSFLDEATLSVPTHGWINLHYSLLPKFRGAAPVQHAILHGDSETGVSVFQLEHGMDTGPVFMRVATRIEPRENSQRLLDRLTTLGSSALLEILPGIAAGIAKSTPQEDSQRSFAPKVSRAEAEIDWNRPASEIENLINAMNPEPMSWSTLNKLAIRVLEGRVAQKPQAVALPGEIVIADDQVLIGCNDSFLILDQVQPAGKSPMSATDWMRGLHGKGPIVLGS